MMRPKLPLPLPKLPKVGRKRPGEAPGTLVHVGRRHMERPRITVLDYDAEHLEEREVQDVTALEPYMERDTITWIDVTGLHDADLIADLGKRFDIHPLVLEDLLNTEQRPKVEAYDGYAFIVLKMATATTPNAIDLEQVSLLVCPNLILTFQEKPGDVFDPVRERIRNGGIRLRHGTVDYLAYALIDAIVDQYGILLENIGLTLEELEERVLTTTQTHALNEVHALRHQLLKLRKTILPMRDLVSALERGDAPQFTQDTRLFLRDVEDHANRAVDYLDANRESAKNLLDLYLSLSSHRMNEIMKVLTIIATIFIPLTFIAGVYGMNFEYMPELEYRWGYPTVWLVMIAAAFTLLTYFRHRRWI